MNIKKVLFISNSIVGRNPGVSGGESRFIELGKYWKSKGYEIHLLSSEGGKNLCEKMGLSVILHKLPSSDEETRLEVVKRMFSLLWYTPNLIQEFREGIVYSTSEQLYDVWPAFILKIFGGKKIRFASAVHWLPPVLFWQRKASRWYNSLLFLLSERAGLLLAYLFADALFPVSESTYNDMYKSYLRGKKIHVVKCGVNLSEINQITSSLDDIKKYDAVFMKRIQSVKGIFDLIDIWEIVVKKIKKAKLIVIGSGVDEEEAKTKVKEKGLSENIEFLGAIYEPKEKYKYVAESKLFLLPSLEENWAIVIGESLACKTPVIVYRLKELEEVWKDSITYIELRDRESFADKVVEYLSNTLEYKDLIKKGSEYIKRYDWEEIASDELKFIMGEK